MGRGEVPRQPGGVVAELRVERRTRGVLPSSVHAHDGEGFEVALHDAMVAIRAHLAEEEAEVTGLLGSLSQADSERMAAAVRRARKGALARPHAPVGRLGHGVCMLLDRLGHPEDLPDYPDRSLHPALRRPA
ncbi:MAG: hypothetical protein ACYDH5_03165 [Acidimicrobiales bacterium]